MSEVRILEQFEEPDDLALAQEAQRRATRWLTCLIEGIILLLALLLVLLVRWSWLEPVLVTSGSMENTLRKDDRVLVDHRQSLHGRWQRGDMVIFETGENWGDDAADTLIKRIVGLPSEQVDVLQGRVYVNGRALLEEYLKETPRPEDAVSVTLGKDEYYVLGDNRNNSDDSRSHGPITEEQIRGRAVYKLYPPARLPRVRYSS